MRIVPIDRACTPQAAHDIVTAVENGQFQAANDMVRNVVNRCGEVASPFATEDLQKLFEHIRAIALDDKRLGVRTTHGGFFPDPTVVYLRGTDSQGRPRIAHWEFNPIY